jgi:hypothetical protein
VVAGESGEVGNPGTLLMTQGEQTMVECRAYGARILFDIDFPALPGWADVWRSALRALHLWRSLPCHFSLNLPQASQLLPRHAGAGGMTKEKATTLSKVVDVATALFLTLSRQRPIQAAEKGFGPTTTLYGTLALPFVIPPAPACRGSSRLAVCESGEK